MKQAYTSFALALAGSVVATPSPAQLEARATAAGSSTLPTVTVQGNAFWTGSSRFYIRGVDYQPGGSSAKTDPLASSSGCARDIPYFQRLGVNTIRVYAVDNTANHDACMNALAQAGIYVALDVNNPLYSLNRADPAPSYNAVYLQSIFATMDAFAKYSNTLLFFSGNEVINDVTNTNCAPYIKAVTRDMKQYRDSRNMRSIPVGYSAADVAPNRFAQATYLNCGNDASARSDFFAFNDYAWCDPSSYTQSGWSANVATYSNYSIPLFLSEYGCIKGARNFEEVAALYNTEMTGVYSGGLVYEYSEEGNNYGLTTISGNSVSPNSGFTNLESQLKSNPAPSGNGGYHSNNLISNCPSAGPEWDVTEFTGDSLPAIPSGATQYMQKGAGNGPGLNGSGSQNAGGASSGTATPGSGASSTSGSSASSSSKGAAAQALSPMSMGPISCIAIMLASACFGTLLL